jgi:AraC-like DNA-binding protein
MGMSNPAKKIYYPARNTDKPDISHSYTLPGGAEEGFFVGDICSKTLRRKMLGKTITVKNWWLECYSGFAGDIYFLTPRAKKRGVREKNSIHLYAPGCKLREDTRNADLPMRETFIHFRKGEAFGLAELTGSKSKFCRFLDPGGKVTSLMLEAAEASALKGDGAFWLVQSIMIKCVYYMLSSSVKISEDTYEIRDKPTSPEEKLVIKTENFMRKNISSNITNSDIAVFLNMSESSFCHKFKKAAGISPNARLAEMRIDTAKNLLLKGARLKNIAEAIGFKSEFYLSKTFKKITGVTPRDFRAGRG